MKKVYCHTDFYQNIGKWYFRKGTWYEAFDDELAYYGTIWIYLYKQQLSGGIAGRGHTFYYGVNKYGRSNDNFKDYFWTENDYRKEKLKKLEVVFNSNSV